MAYLKLWFYELRAHQWVKNIFVFGPLFFSGKLSELSALIVSIECFIVFCIISSSVYIINDIVDVEKDKLHPRKSKRPIASGIISINAGLAASGLLLAIGLLWSSLLGFKIVVIVAAYIVNSIVYSYYLKHKVIADVLSIAIGFMLRFIAGAVVIDVSLSRWFVVCGFGLALYLAFGKRRVEIEMLDNDVLSKDFRPILEVYSKNKLDASMVVVNAMCIISYILFVTDPDTIRIHRTENLVYTVPLVVYGLFRYMYKTQEGRGDGPMDIVFKDRAFVLALLVWIAMVSLILYWR